MAGCAQEMHQQFGVPLEIDSAVRPAPLPQWGKRTIGKFGATVLRPLMKLRQPRDRIDFQKFGKSVGVINRGITFFRMELNEIFAKDGLDDITAEQWEKIQPSSQTRAVLKKLLGRPVAKAENLEDLVKGMIEKWIKGWEEMRDRAFLLMAHRNAKENAMFLKGLSQGYAIFIDEKGQFCSSRGRADIYMQLLSSLHEIEKMRCTVPGKKDGDLYQYLKPWYRFSRATDEDNIHWLRNVCDDVSLYLTDKRGRPPGPSPAPAF